MLRYAKGIAAAASAVLVVLVPFLPLDSTVEHWIQAAIAVCGAVAVYQIPNSQVPPPST
jgi:hypothetical protein